MAPNAADCYQAKIIYSRSEESIKIEPLTLTEFPRKPRLNELAKNFLQKLKKNDKVCVNDELWVDIEQELCRNGETEKKSEMQVTPDFYGMEGEEIENDTDISGDVQSELVTKKTLNKIAEHLPANTFGKKWNLIYSTSEHGYSLQSLYRKSRSWGLINELHHDVTPTLMIVKVTKGHSFGVGLSCLPRVNKNRFVGNGESFLCQLEPDFKIYRWSCLNDSILNCGFDSFRVGGSKNGGFGLCLDNDLRFGRSMKCETFNNEILSSNEDFEILGVELWGFIA